MANKKSALSPYSKLSAPEFFSSGCTILDCSLGGGWAENRVNNIIGDSSTGKTLLAIIACKMYALKYPDRKKYYLELEKAFDPNFAKMLGLKEDNLEFPELPKNTVESLFDFLEALVDKDEPALVIVDSLDAISTEDELEGDFSAGYHGARKAERMSSFFRQLNDKMAGANLTILIVSQTREKIGVVYGKKWTRAGGKALDFYSSQVLVLWHKTKLTKQVAGIKRVIGTVTTAILEKNKVGIAYRSVNVPLLFFRGIDDVKASVDWLYEAKRLGGKDVPENEAALQLPASVTKAETYATFQGARSPQEFDAMREALRLRTKRCWDEVEALFFGTEGFAADEGGAPETPESETDD